MGPGPVPGKHEGAELVVFRDAVGSSRASLRRIVASGLFQSLEFLGQTVGFFGFAVLQGLFD